MRAMIAGMLCAGCLLAAKPSAAAGPPASIAIESPAAVAPLAATGSPLALPSSTLYLVRDAKAAATRGGEGGNQPRLGAERARILLRSLTVPGWGQATLGRGRSAKVFGVAELGVWTTFAAFRVQEHLRRDSYEVTARLFAGIDLDGRDEEFRRIVGFYPSSEEYNRLVVRRDAANLYYDNPTLYAEYIAEHELQGKDAWAWASSESYDRYQEQRKLTRKAALRANAMLGLAIANRLLSAVHAARYAGAAPASPQSWNIECGPRESDPSVMALGVKVRF